MGCFIRGSKDKTIYIFNSHIIPPITGGERYDYEIGNYLSGAGYSVRFIEESDVFQFKRKGLTDSILLILRMSNIVNKSVMVFDEGLHKRMNLFCLFLRIFTNAKLLTVVHHLTNPLREGNLKRMIDMLSEWLFLHLMHRIVVNSEYTKSQVRGLGIKKDIKVIHPAVDLIRRQRRKRKSKEMIDMLFVGYLEKRKGLHILLKALGMMDRQGIKWRLRVVGDMNIFPDYTDECIKIANQYGISQNVEFLGKLEKHELEREYENADIFVLPSLHEGYGIAIKESASYGLPIITTNVGAIPELVRNGDSAILVKPGNIKELRDALKMLIEDNRLRESLGRSALATIDFDYNWNKVGEMFENFMNVPPSLTPKNRRKRKLKVMIVIVDLSIGGIEGITSDLALNLPSEYFDVHFTSWKGGGPLEEKFKGSNVKLHILNCKGIKKFLSPFRIYNLLVKERIDILHGHPGAFARLAGWFAHTPIIISSTHNTYVDKKWYQIFLDKLFSNITDRIISVSDAVRDFELKQIGIRKDKYTTIYNGVDIDRFINAPKKYKARHILGLKRDKIYITSLGRFHEQKGMDIFIRACEIIKGSHPEVGFILAGYGPQENELRSLCEDVGLSDSMKFLIARRDPEVILSASDIFVCASRWGGFEIVLAEAMASGLPIVATNVGPIPEVIVDGKTGYIVRPDCPEEIAERVIMLIENKKLRRELGEMGRRRTVEKFTIRRMADETVKLYFEFAEKKMKNLYLKFNKVD
ncbi:MAG: glycosyltransferase family 4 protein [bacterium]